MGFITKAVTGLWGGLTGTGAADAAHDAADIQSRSAREAMQLQRDQYARTRADLQPFTDLGKQSINPLLQAMGYRPTMQNGRLTGINADPNNILQQKFTFNPGDLSKTPGYQFTLNQGLNAVQNSNAARGLGLSGAQLKGMADYTTGLADNTYQHQFNNALQGFMTNANQQSNQVNRLMQLLTGGQNAAAGLGSLGAQTTNQLADLATQRGNAQAAGEVGAANAYGKAAENILGVVTAGLSGKFSTMFGNNGGASTGAVSTNAFNKPILHT